MGILRRDSLPGRNYSTMVVCVEIEIAFRAVRTGMLRVLSVELVIRLALVCWGVGLVRDVGVLSW